VVVSLAHPVFTRVAVEGNQVRAGAGARLKQVAVEARRASLSGLEFLEGIPGSVGGALRMNAGAHAARTFDVLDTVRFMTPSGETRERPASEVPAGYRSCPFFADHLALAAVFRGQPAEAPVIRAQMEELSEWRRANQPRQPSAGCIFKNPDAIPAGRLIDQLGLKGSRVGGAEVSPVHANFMVNTGGATARDFLELIAQVRARVRAAAGIELETEVEIVGED
jgi:UDP-N-acetylenolpyruvoylglucosamine reductase